MRRTGLVAGDAERDRRSRAARSSRSVPRGAGPRDGRRTRHGARAGPGRRAGGRRSPLGIGDRGDRRLGARRRNVAAPLRAVPDGVRSTLRRARERALRPIARRRRGCLPARPGRRARPRSDGP
jgi:hypothetical protein